MQVLYKMSLPVREILHVQSKRKNEKLNIHKNGLIGCGV